MYASERYRTPLKLLLRLDAPAGAGGSGGSAPAGATQGEPGMRLYLSQIREWYVELSADMLFIHIRTDVAWYKLLT